MAKQSKDKCADTAFAAMGDQDIVDSNGDVEDKLDYARRLTNEVREDLKSLRMSGELTPKRLAEYRKKTAADIEKQALIAENMKLNQEMVQREFKNSFFRKVKEHGTHKVDEVILNELIGAYTFGTNSVDTLQKTTEAQWAGLFKDRILALENGDAALNAFMRGEISENVWQASFLLRTGDKAAASKIGGPALQVAEVWNDTIEFIRTKQSDAGYHIEDLESYVATQTTLPDKLVKRKGETEVQARDRWTDDVLQEINYERTFGISEQAFKANPEPHLAYLHDIYSNLKDEFHPGSDINIGAKSIGKSGKARKLHFKDGAAMYRYDKKYGIGDIGETMDRLINSASRKYAVSKKVGPNPDVKRSVSDIINSIRDEYETVRTNENLSAKEREDARKALVRLDSDKFKNNISDAVDAISGAKDIVVNKGVYKAERMYKMTKNWSLLWGSGMTAAVLDPIMNSYRMSTQFGNTVTQNFKFFKDVLDTSDGKFGRSASAAHSSGVAVNDFNHSIAGFGDGGSNTDLTSKANRILFKINGLTMITTKMRKAAVKGVSNNIALESDLKFNDLGTGLRSALAQNGILADEWNAIRQLKAKTLVADSEEWVITPDLIANASDDVIDSYLAARGQASNKITRRRTRENLAENYRAYVANTVHTGILEPNLRAQMALYGRSRPGEKWHLAKGISGHLLSHPLAAIFAIIGNIRAASGLSYGGTIGDYAKAYKSWTPSVGMFAVQSALGGLAVNFLFDLAKGRDPIREDYNPFTEGGRATWRDAVIRGGAAGILTDFVMGEAARTYGQSPVERMLGPGVADVSKVIRIINDANVLTNPDANFSKAKAETAKFIMNNLPNHVFLHAILQHGVKNPVLDAVDPGYSRRSAGYLKQRTGQESFVKEPIKEVIPWAK